MSMVVPLTRNALFPRLVYRRFQLRLPDSGQRFEILVVSVVYDHVGASTIQTEVESITVGTSSVRVRGVVVNNLRHGSTIGARNHSED